MNKCLLFFPKYLIKLFLIINFLGIPSFSFAGNELGVSTFMYHRFGENRYPTTSVTKEQFQSHIRYIIENNINVNQISEFDGAFLTNSIIGVLPIKNIQRVGFIIDDRITKLRKYIEKCEITED